MITSTSICNDALLEIGAERIVSLSDTSKRALICNEQYEKLRDYVLTCHPWVFSIKRAELAQLVSTPEFGYAYQYQLPSDCLRVLKTDEGEEYKVEGVYLLTDATTAFIQYISRVTDASKYSPNFAMALSKFLAANICYPITQSRELVNDLRADFQRILQEARSVDAMAMGTPNDFEVDEFLLSRL